jgi:putative phosphoesterase
VRFAVVSDVHGNLTALDAVIADLAGRGVDRIVHGGDLALGGCRPAEVIDRIHELGWPGVVGNTDELLWRPELLEAQLRRAPKLADLLRAIFERHAPATRAAVGAERLEWLRALPPEKRLDSLVVLHASPGDLWRAPRPDADDDELLAAYSSCDADLVVYGHIHVPFVRPLPGFTVANSGSAGAPYDGDPRACYLLVEESRVEVVRVEYDIEREVALVLASDYPGRDEIAEARRTGRYVAPSGTPRPARGPTA